MCSWRSRLHNMRTIDGHPTLAKQQLVAEETLALFVPLAEWIGLQKAAEELSRMGVQVLRIKT